MKEITGPYLDSEERQSKRVSGHILLYRPDHPKANKTGYILRSHLIWEAHHGPLRESFLIHHKNGDASDDSIENLEAMISADHVRLHKPWRGVGWLKRLRAKLIESDLRAA